MGFKDVHRNAPVFSLLLNINYHSLFSSSSRSALEERRDFHSSSSQFIYKQRKQRICFIVHGPGDLYKLFQAKTNCLVLRLVIYVPKSKKITRD